MCGICGIWNRDDNEVTPELLESMTRRIAHRGPDHQDVFHDRSLGLGFCRLAILDLSPAGNQPMTTADGRFTIVFNGEAYNFRDLRKELEQAGCEFRGHSDAEVVLYGFARWGPAVFERLDGMFGLAIWDARQRRLTLARDRFGIKPLFWCDTGSDVLFGSEIKALLAADRIERQINWQAFHEYLYFGTSLGCGTFFEGIRQLGPGHYLQVEQDSVQEIAYSRVTDFQPVRDDYPIAVRQVRRLLEQSVQRHMISDVPVGAFLSGGIDSASIVAIASRLSEQPLDTFTARFDFDPSADETAQARAVATEFGTRHHELDIRAGDIADVVVRLVSCHDVPFGDMANLPLYLLCEKLSGNPKVILQGDGGDEVFGGYKRYQRIARRRWFRLAGPLALALRPVLPATSAAYRSLNTFHAFCRVPESRQLAWLLSQERFDALPERILGPDTCNRLQGTDPFRTYEQCHELLRDREVVEQMMLTDCLVLLPNQYFEKVDRATMAHGIEVRVPMVDVPLSRYVLGLPVGYRVNLREKKRVLRDAMRGTVPDRILDGPKKGFGVPVDQWFREPLFDFVSETLGRASRQYGLFDDPSLNQCLTDHRTGKANHGALLFKLLNFCIWLDEYSPSLN